MDGAGEILQDKETYSRDGGKPVGEDTGGLGSAH